MAQFTRAWNLLAGARHRARPYSAQEWDATSGIADMAAEHVLSRRLCDREKETGAALVHYGSAATMGALYGGLVPARMRSKHWAGPLFGFIVWMIGNQLLMPAIGVTKKPREYTTKMRINALGEHLVYGLTLQLFCGN